MYVWVLGTGESPKDWRKPEGLAVSRKVDGWSFFYTGLGIWIGGGEDGREGTG